jgi:hypothetical protein
MFVSSSASNEIYITALLAAASLVVFIKHHLVLLSSPLVKLQAQVRMFQMKTEELHASLCLCLQNGCTTQVCLALLLPYMRYL